MTDNSKKSNGNQRGGKREGAGRPKGGRSRATKEQKATLSDLAQQKTEQALQALVDVMQNSSSDSARVAAANAILDRGYGKPPQSLEHTGDEGGPLETITRIELVAYGEDESEDNSSSKA